MSVPSGSVRQFRCAFFNFTGGANRTGGWSYRGVKTEVINDTHVRCNASHLTSFAVLVSIVPAEDTVSVTIYSLKEHPSASKQPFSFSLKYEHIYCYSAYVIQQY